MNIDSVSQGKNFPEEINVFIEIPENSSIKYELDKDTGLVVVDRFMYTAMAYPFNYGFIPGTKAEDGDPVDVLVISSQPVHPGVMIPARPVGLLEMEDEAGPDNKILAVPTEKVDPYYAHIKDIDDIGTVTKEKIKHFFEYYKELEKGKWVKLKNFMDRKAALADIEKSKI